MSSLTFRNADLKIVRNSALVQWKIDVVPLYGKKAGEGYWLVGDSGCYLMHNGQSVPGVERQPVAMAVECDPANGDDWMTVKRSTFGGDDGVDFLPRRDIDPIIDSGKDLVLDFSERHMVIRAAE